MPIEDDITDPLFGDSDQDPEAPDATPAAEPAQKKEPDPPARTEPPKAPPVEPPAPGADALIGQLGDVLIDAGEARQSIRQNLMTEFVNEGLLSNTEVDEIMQQVNAACKGNPALYRQILNEGTFRNPAAAKVGTKFMKGQIKPSTPNKGKESVSVGGRTESQSSGNEVFNAMKKGFQDPELERMFKKLTAKGDDKVKNL